MNYEVWRVSMTLYVSVTGDRRQVPVLQHFVQFSIPVWYMLLNLVPRVLSYPPQERTLGTRLQVALQPGFPETLSICLQILVKYLLDHAKHCSDLCATVYTSATGIYNTAESLVPSNLTRKIKVGNTLGIIFVV